MNITHQTVIDSSGAPAWAMIPWADFVRIQALLEDEELSSGEIDALREAEADRLAGNRAAFTDLAALKAELSL